MKIVLETTNISTNSAYLQASLKRIARRNILLKSLKTADLYWNSYCVSKYHCTLKQLCLRALATCKIFVVGTSSITILFSQEFDSVLDLITYGDGIHYGSNIMQNVLRSKK